MSQNHEMKLFWMLLCLYSNYFTYKKTAGAVKAEPSKGNLIVFTRFILLQHLCRIPSQNHIIAK